MTVIRPATPIQHSRFANERGSNEQNDCAGDEWRENLLENARADKGERYFKQRAYEGCACAKSTIISEEWTKWEVGTNRGGNHTRQDKGLE